MVQLTSSSVEETERLAARLASVLVPNDVVTVAGELGSGKTTFIRGACRALGVGAPVTSPTFTIGHRYEGRSPISHLDLYRFSGVSAAEWGDIEPYFERSIVFVEWPEAAAGALPPVRFSVGLEHLDAESRLITVESSDRFLLEGALRGADARL
ncbi:MAG: tRNA (adenosine(37)-N6)-threonylcarbamoyltransferase complex ATPase subunit type 1 TsaE [Actinobacteria bacterium]|nr:tRNA (adenosine(37)-N6)-threonylcarbamoyltransferase complex ATPase subunit type 1 TsaE [Actinomycetota bacterium]